MKMFKSILQKLNKVIRQEVETTRAMRRLAQIPLDYAALQAIADTVSNGWEVLITVETKDGARITFTKSNPGDSSFKTFKDAYNAKHNK